MHLSRRADGRRSAIPILVLPILVRRFYKEP